MQVRQRYYRCKDYAPKPGELDITVSASPALTQQDGFFHAGVSTSLADTAAGFAAYTLFQNESDL